jgi:hypothetical protein
MDTPEQLGTCQQRIEVEYDGKVVYYICQNPNSKHYNAKLSGGFCDKCNKYELKTTPIHKGVSESTPPTATGPKAPNIVRRALSYAEAIVEWNAAGKPERSNEEVQGIFQQLCRPCKRFNAEKQMCLDCGCRVADSGYVLFNKIKMATQHCPKGKW